MSEAIFILVLLPGRTGEADYLPGTEDEAEIKTFKWRPMSFAEEYHYVVNDSVELATEGARHPGGGKMPLSLAQMPKYKYCQRRNRK